MQSPQQIQFASLADAHKPVIYAVINKYCKDTNYKDDLYQDILAQAWKAYDSFRGDCQFTSWIYSIARHTAIDRLRRARNNIISVANDNIFYSIVDEPYEEVNLPVTQTLSAIEKKTLDLYIDGLSYKQISDITNEPTKRIAIRMFRIKKQLSKSVSKINNY